MHSSSNNSLRMTARSTKCNSKVAICSVSKNSNRLVTSFTNCNHSQLAIRSVCQLSRTPAKCLANFNRSRPAICWVIRHSNRMLTYLACNCSKLAMCSISKHSNRMVTYLAKCNRSKPAICPISRHNEGLATYLAHFNSHRCHRWNDVNFQALHFHRMAINRLPISGSGTKTSSLNSMLPPRV